MDVIALVPLLLNAAPGRRRVRVWQIMSRWWRRRQRRSPPDAT